MAAGVFRRPTRPRWRRRWVGTAPVPETWPPTLVIECAFGSNPGDATYTWTAITGAVRSLSYQRGRQNELDRVEAGTGSLVLGDATSNFDPDNTASPYSPNVRPMVPIRARVTIGATVYPLFLHFVEQWRRTLVVGNVYTERDITTVDGFPWLAQAGLAGDTYAQEASGTRVGNVLTNIGWSSTLRDLDTGNTTIAAVTYAADDDTKALTHLLDVANTENGLFYIDGDGRVALVARHALITTPYTVSQATFHDAGSSVTGSYGYVDLTRSYDLDQVINEWRGTRAGGTTQTAADTTSQDRYGQRTRTLTSLATTDNEVSSQVQWKLRRSKDPLSRVESITVMPGRNLDAWQTLLTLDAGSRVTVREQPPGFGSVQAVDYAIQHVTVRIPVGPLEQTEFTFQLWPADSSAWLILDDANAGKLDTGALAY